MAVQPHAVVLLSGGMDSAVVLAMARREGFACHALSFDYGQRHRAELVAARKVARALGVVQHLVLEIGLRTIGGSALTDDIPVPKDRLPKGRQPKDRSSARSAAASADIPPTYVPARNTIFLSCGVALAETVGARDLFLGVNAVDYSGYPDCRPEFLRAFERTANLATRAGVEDTGAKGRHFRIHAPLGRMSKRDIVRAGLELGVDFGMTHTCYDPPSRRGGGRCGRCDACVLRARGFAEAGVPDALVLREESPRAPKRAPKAKSVAQKKSGASRPASQTRTEDRRATAHRSPVRR